MLTNMIDGLFINKHENNYCPTIIKAISTIDIICYSAIRQGI